MQVEVKFEFYAEISRGLVAQQSLEVEDQAVAVDKRPGCPIDVVDS